jgi:pimeloyl-ACP methyl ester carboxylesterase
MIVFWTMLLLVSGVVRRGLGLCLSTETVNFHRWGSASACGGRHRKSDCLLGATRSSEDQYESGSMEGISWLSGKDSKGSYRLAYRHVLPSINKSGSPTTAVLFCNGFRSAMTGGTKAIALEEHCQQRGWEFCSFDYRGHGLSSGSNFEECTLTDWIRDASDMLDRVLLPSKEKNRRKRVILVGSSMGAWISTHLALRYNNRSTTNADESLRRPAICGILGIAAAPDFLQDLYFSSTAEIQATWRANGVIRLPSSYGEPYPISWSLLEDAARCWGILPSTKAIPSVELPVSADRASLSVHCPVRLLHGRCDEDVSWEKSQELSFLLKGCEAAAPECGNNDNKTNSRANNNDVVLTLIEDGDHRLSRPQDVQLLLDTLDDMVIRF